MSASLTNVCKALKGLIMQVIVDSDMHKYVRVYVLFGVPEEATPQTTSWQRMWVKPEQ